MTLSLLGAASYALASSSLLGQLDAQLRVVSANAYLRENPSQAASGETQDVFISLNTAQGAPLAQQGTTDAPALPTLTLDQAVERSGKPFDAVDPHTGTRWRVDVSAPVLLADRGASRSTTTGYLLVAIGYQQTDSALRQLATGIFGVVLVSVCLGTLVAYLLVTRSFRPLGRVEETAAAIAEGELSRRVPEEQADNEVGRLSHALNTMLSRIEAAFNAQKQSENKMRQFVADASHELRTPLVSIRGYAELHRHGALVTEQDVSAAMARIESEAKRMSALVDDLLLLARMDEKRPRPHTEVDLAIIANDAVVDAKARASDRKIELGKVPNSRPMRATVSADDAQMRQIATNLIGNALRYTPDSTPIEVAVGVISDGEGPPVAIFSVIDHGQGIKEEESQKIFERFYRSEESRGRDSGGSGLGLAIVSAVAATHDGTVRYTSTPGGGATFTVSLPWAASHDQDDDG